jgi:hypothetical protein
MKNTDKQFFIKAVIVLATTCLFAAAVMTVLAMVAHAGGK